MYIQFRTAKLRKCYEQINAAQKEWSKEMARNYIKCVNILKSIQNLSDLRAFPQINYHSLKGNRKGQHSIKLGRRMRLIFTLTGHRQENIRIEEVSRHYEQ